jgi:hypothetical protein
MVLCCVCYLLSSRGLCDELITHPEGPADCGASLCVIKVPRGRGGHSPRWAAEPDKINNNNNNKDSQTKYFFYFTQIIFGISLFNSCTRN